MLFEPGPEPEPVEANPAAEVQIAQDTRLAGLEAKAEVGGERQAAFLARPIATWGAAAVRVWMTSILDLPELGAAAEGERIDGATAVEMDKDDWKELGATGLQAARLVGAVKKLG